MGELKALLPWLDTTLIEHQVDILASAGVSYTVVVLGHESERLERMFKGRSGLAYVHNPDYRQGKTTSVKAGVRVLQTAENIDLDSGGDSVLILNVDQPRSSDTIRRVIELHTSRGEDRPDGKRHLITVPTYRGKGGHPIVLSASLMDELMDVSEETRGIKAVVRRHEDQVLRVELGSPEVLLDLNTPEDYQRAVKSPTAG